jgi:2'-5' RNA ligase
MKRIDKNQLDLFGPQTWYEYRLIITPGKEISDAITARKEKIQALLGGTQLAHIDTHPHIPLLTFLHTEHELIIKRIIKILDKQRSFDIKLKGADFFEPTPESKILYLSVMDNRMIQLLAEQLKNEIGRGAKSNSHMMIAGGISTANHKILNAFMNDFHYEGEFTCTGITVLRRLKDAQDTSWDFQIELAFGNVVTGKKSISRIKTPIQRPNAGL